MFRAGNTGGNVEADWLGDLQSRLTDRQVDLDELLRQVVDEATRRVGADRGTLYLVDHARQELVSRVAHLPEISEIRLKMGEGIAGWVADTGRVLNVPEGDQDPRFSRRIDSLTGYRTTSLIAFPVTLEGVLVGVLQLLNKRSGWFTTADESLISELCERIATLLNATSLASQLRPPQQHPLSFRFNHIVGESPSMREVYERVSRAAATMATVLIRGDTGTGKELVARAVHYNSDRREQALVKVDCAALPHNLIENELFGHVRGAFTGADRDADGKVHAANGGTLFLDEIGELPLTVQGSLLRLLQDRAYLRVGDTRPRSADVRFVCATHVDLEKAIAEGKFRQDLYYRLRVVEITTPPLHERGALDLDRLVDHFLYRFSQRHKRSGIRLSTKARAALHAHSWPGNVRELEHCLESAIVLAPTHVITPDLFPMSTSVSSTPGRAVSDDSGAFIVSDVRPLREVERDYIQHVLDHCGGNRSAAARELGIGRNTLNRKLKDT